MCYQATSVVKVTAINRFIISGRSRKQGFQSIEREARKIWGYAHFRCSKTRENPILSQGKSHLRLRGTAAICANSQLASLG